MVQGAEAGWWFINGFRSIDRLWAGNRCSGQSRIHFRIASAAHQISFRRYSMRFLVMPAALIAALSVSAVAMAQPARGAAPPVKVKSGQMIYSSDGAALGRVDYVQETKDGAPQDVAVIRNMRMVHIPGDS